MIELTSSEDIHRLTHEYLAKEDYIKALETINFNQINYFTDFKSTKANVRYLKFLLNAAFDQSNYIEQSFPKSFRGKDKTLYMQLVYYYQRTNNINRLDQLWELKSTNTYNQTSWFSDYLIDTNQLNELYLKSSKYDQYRYSCALFKSRPEEFKQLIAESVKLPSDAWVLSEQLNIIGVPTKEQLEFNAMLYQQFIKEPEKYCQELAKTIIPVVVRKLPREKFEDFFIKIQNLLPEKNRKDIIIRIFIQYYRSYFGNYFIDFLNIAAKLKPIFAKDFLTLLEVEYSRQYLLFPAEILIRISNLIRSKNDYNHTN